MRSPGPSDRTGRWTSWPAGSAAWARPPGPTALPSSEVTSLLPFSPSVCLCLPLVTIGFLNSFFFLCFLRPWNPFCPPTCCPGPPIPPPLPALPPSCVCPPPAPQFVVVVSIINFKQLTYDDYVFPLWANWVGWGVALSSMTLVPAYIAYKFLSTPGSLWEVSSAPGGGRGAVWEGTPGSFLPG